MTRPADTDETLRVDSTDALVQRRSRDEEQFAPGTIIAGRYRIASILGSGGMGEVYRAEDTKLGQAVALKFLPARLARDPLLLDRLHEEVRLGRQIAHPNVCRIYDIGESDGAHFLAMEYVDGEDLARLLTRIGRLASDKAVDIARGIAAGLAAAHGKGILHRDLKPANIMIDSRGDARIMDFGLALDSGESDGTVSGTPAYMAPEQLAGEPATVQSDLYALGLVMYELFTGKRALSACTIPERIRDITSEITTPSSVIRDIDPAVERIILRCLANEAAQRPRSAREVIHALPGGDPLQAALAAGETPSPRIVAAAGTAGSLKPAVAWSLLLATLACLAILVAGKHRFGLGHYTTFDKSPLVLLERTSTVLRTLGIPEQPYRSYEHRTQDEYFASIFRNRAPRKWEQLRAGPPVLTFATVESAAPQPASLRGDILMRPGTTEAEVDHQGRLFSLTAMPQQRWRVRPVDWNSLLASAGLDPKYLTPAEPRLVPPVPSDARSAWSGRYRDSPTPIHVEAATWRGTPVFFRITGAWEAASVDEVPFEGSGLQVFFSALFVVVLTIGAFLGWRNLQLRRGDRTGALRIAMAVIAADIVSGLLTARHYPAALYEVTLLQHTVAAALLWGVIAWLLYLALEPLVRRRWPEHLIASTRLLRGEYRDPMVGRDVLIGVVGGGIHVALIMASYWFAELAGGDTTPLDRGPGLALNGTRFAVGRIVAAFSTGAIHGFAVIVLLVAFALLLRKRVLAALALAGIHLIGYAVAAHITPFTIAMTAAIVFIIARYGLLTAAIMQATFHCTFHYPMFRGRDWSSIDALPLIVIIALAVWAFRTSLGDQPVFAKALDE